MPGVHQVLRRGRLTPPVKASPLDTKMTNQSKIKKTKQEWKLIGSFVSLLVCAAGMFYGINKMHGNGNFPVYIDLFSVAAGIIVGVFACTSIRCPDCHLKWVWFAISKKDANQWVPWLLSFEECPQCELLFEKKTVSKKEDAPDQKAVR